MTCLDLLVFALPRLAGIAALGLLAHAIGRRLTRGIRYASGWERWSFATALGLGVLSTLLLALAALQLLTLPAALAALLAAGAAAGPAWKEMGRDRRRLAELVPGARLPHDAEFSRLFERISTDGEVDVYRVAAPTPGSPAPGSGRAAPGA